jgi:hypothetical protein
MLVSLDVPDTFLLLPIVPPADIVAHRVKRICTFLMRPCKGSFGPYPHGLRRLSHRSCAEVVFASAVDENKYLFCRTQGIFRSLRIKGVNRDLDFMDFTRLKNVSNLQSVQNHRTKVTQLKVRKSSPPKVSNLCFEGL